MLGSLLFLLYTVICRGNEFEVFFEGCEVGLESRR